MLSIQAAVDAFWEVLNCAKPSNINPTCGSHMGISLPILSGIPTAGGNLVWELML